MEQGGASAEEGIRAYYQGGRVSTRPRLFLTVGQELTARIRKENAEMLQKKKDALGSTATCTKCLEYGHAKKNCPDWARGTKKIEDLFKAAAKPTVQGEPGSTLKALNWALSLEKTGCEHAQCKDAGYCLIEE